MSTKNDKAFKEAEKMLNNKGFYPQIITGKNPTNVIAMVVSGYKFDRLSGFIKSDALELARDIIENGVAKAYEHHTYNRNSTAKQKINDAHGRSYRECTENHNTQEMTYASRWCAIQLYNRTIKDVLTMACGLDKVQDDKVRMNVEINEYKNFVKTYININGNSQKAYQFFRENYIIVDGLVVSIKYLTEVIDKWITENNIKTEFDKIEVIRKFEKYRQQKELQAV